MSIRRDDLSPGKKALRSLGLTVLLMTALVTAGLAVTYLSIDAGSAWQRVALAASVAAASVACFAMTADAFDFWVRGRKMTPSRLRVMRLLILIAMLAAMVLSLVVAGSALLLTLTPALMIYLFGVVRSRPAPIRRPADLPRQRRGGKKRK